MVLTNPAHSPIEWHTAAKHRCVITLSNRTLFFAAFEQGVHEGVRELRAVVFDRSVRTIEYLEFLTSLTTAFRGDALLIQRNGRGYLSAVATPGHGRHLYRLSSDDVEFYLRTEFGELRDNDELAEAI
jgi:hypothetical protein